MIPKVAKGQYEQVKDYKTTLQEELQVDGDITIRYEVISEEGPAHAKSFEVRVMANNKELSRGKGRSKKMAEQEAARKALDQLGEV